MKKSLLPLLAASALFGSSSFHAHAGVPTYSGGDGSTMEKAVIIKGATEETGVHAEYDYLSKHFPGYHKGNQAVMGENGKKYDRLEYTTAKGEKKTIFFDITDFFGKM